MEKKDYKYDWLPENRTAWYLKEACSLKRDTKVSILVLRVLSNSMA